MRSRAPNPGITVAHAASVDPSGVDGVGQYPAQDRRAPDLPAPRNGDAYSLQVTGDAEEARSLFVVGRKDSVTTAAFASSSLTPAGSRGLSGSTR